MSSTGYIQRKKKKKKKAFMKLANKCICANQFSTEDLVFHYSREERWIHVYNAIAKHNYNKVNRQCRACVCLRCSCPRNLVSVQSDSRLMESLMAMSTPESKPFRNAESVRQNDLSLSKVSRVFFGKPGAGEGRGGWAGWGVGRVGGWGVGVVRVLWSDR